ncbi:MAG: MarR family transcriptional regulator [Lachnospiraceae bacterium]|nr:MarR family transcriptional regulator [Lachnospiraceae bacterium]
MDTPKDISTLYRKMNMIVNSRLLSLGLTCAKAMFLCCLFDHKQMTQVEMCRDLDMDKSTVTKMLMRLEKDGLITKTVHPDDIRAFQVMLTDKATALVPKAREIQQEWLDEVTSKLTDLEKRNYFELLEKVAIVANEIS